MAVTVVPIQIRRGNEADFNASKMLPGEFAVSLDQKITRIAFAPGDVAILAKQADLDSLEARIEDVERDASSASDATTTLGNTVSTLSTRVSQAENDIDVLESDVDALETASTKAVKVNASQNFTTAEKAQARTNIGAASTEDVAGVVKYTAQTLTDAQKTQARSNIGAVSSAEVTGVVKYGEAQTLTDAQKTQVRVNTGTASASAVAPEFATNKAYAVGDMVTYQGKMYTFKAAHGAGAWNAAHVNETNAGAEISNIKGDLSDALGANIIEYPYTDATKTQNGITWTDNGDGSVTANGTATATTIFLICGWSIDNGSIHIDKENQYILSGCPNGGDVSTYFTACRAYQEGVTPASNTGDVLRDFGGGVGLRGYEYISIYLAVIKGTQVSNLRFLPRLEKVTNGVGIMVMGQSDKIDTMVNTIPQNFTKSQQEQARKNIWAICYEKDGIMFINN